MLRVAAAHTLLRAMVRNAWGLDSPPTGDDARLDARAYRAAERALDDLKTPGTESAPFSPEDVVAALERARIRPPAIERGRVPVLDYERARTRLFDVVYLLGLEEGSLPRRARPSPFLSDDARRTLGGRLERPDPVARDRYLFYTACTRALERLVLVREASNDEGVPRDPSPFWDATITAFPTRMSMSRLRHGFRRRLIEFFLRGVRIAAHPRSYIPGKHTTLKEHRPKKHQDLEWTTSRMTEKGHEIGPSTAAVLEQIMKSRKHPELGYRSCLGVLRLGNDIRMSVWKQPVGAPSP